MCRFVMDGKREDERPLSAFDATITCGSGRGIALRGWVWGSHLAVRLWLHRRPRAAGIDRGRCARRDGTTFVVHPVRGTLRPHLDLVPTT